MHVNRFLYTLKKYVKNRARPEGSIAETYIDNECMNFCSMYFENVETRFNRQERNYDVVQGQQRAGLYVFAQNVRPLGAATHDYIGVTELAKARMYVLNNSPEINDYLM